MNKPMWFLIGVAVGELWFGWLMHIIYLAIIGVLVWGKLPF